jgi:hypothetical protein
LFVENGKRLDTTIYYHNKMMIYRLVCDDGFFWIGYSTAKNNDTTKELKHHKNASKELYSHKAYRHIKQNWDNVKIEVIKADLKDERTHEQVRDYIFKEQDNTKCLNLYNSDGSKTSDHPKYRAEYQAKYKAKNRDEQNRKAREKYAQDKAKAQLTANLTEA